VKSFSNNLYPELQVKGKASLVVKEAGNQPLKTNAYKIREHF